MKTEFKKINPAYYIFCDECKYFYRNFLGLSLCTNDKAIRVITVSLLSKKNYPFCDFEREYGSCTLSGINFEPKENKLKGVLKWLQKKIF